MVHAGNGEVEVVIAHVVPGRNCAERDREPGLRSACSAVPDVVLVSHVAIVSAAPGRLAIIGLAARWGQTWPPPRGPLARGPWGRGRRGAPHRKRNEPLSGEYAQLLALCDEPSSSAAFLRRERPETHLLLEQSYLEVHF
jgi:hypothetical protein